SYGDWSSDVCSSDLDLADERGELQLFAGRAFFLLLFEGCQFIVDVREGLFLLGGGDEDEGLVGALGVGGLGVQPRLLDRVEEREIGRASCRESVLMW